MAVSFIFNVTSYKFASCKKCWFDTHPTNSCRSITHLLNPVSADLLLLLFLHMSKVLSSRWGENLISDPFNKTFHSVNAVLCCYLCDIIITCTPNWKYGGTRRIYKLNVFIGSVAAYFSYALLPARCQCFWHNALSSEAVPLFRPCPLHHPSPSSWATSHFL